MYLAQRVRRHGGRSAGLTWLGAAGGAGAAADGEAAARWEPERLLPGDVEVDEHPGVGEQLAEARHLGARGAAQGRAARRRGALGRLEVRRARQHFLQARHERVRQARGGGGGARVRTDGRGGAGSREDEEEEDEHGGATHPERARDDGSAPSRSI
jgi:hypothetical protein